MQHIVIIVHNALYSWWLIISNISYIYHYMQSLVFNSLDI